MSMDICPLYKDVSDLKPWANSGGNAGLVFNKFASGWAKTKFWEFDKTGGPGKWLNRFSQRSIGDTDLLKEATSRQRDLIQSVGGKTFAFKNVSRFVMGMGNAHPLENGLTWHPTLGTPYLPASSLKGTVRSWDLQEYGEDTEKERVILRKEAIQAFGSQSRVGDLIFFDLLPLRPVKLVREIMTPHYSGYYQDKNVPGDWESPIPIQYLAVEEGCEWQLGVAFHRREALGDQAFWNGIDRLISDALTWAGAGGKTAIGFGRFERVDSTEKSWDSDRKKREGEQIEKQRQTEAKEALEKEYSSMPQALVEIRRASDEGSWLEDGGGPNPDKFPPGLTEYLESKTELSTEVLDWLRKIFEKRHPNLWKNPDETAGKKNKAVHKPAWSNLVKKVKALPVSPS